MQSIRILVVDDHAIVREMLQERLHREPQFTVVAVAAAAAEAIEQVFEHHPDIVLMDIDMPGLNSFDAARRIMTFRPGTRIIFFTAHLRDHYIEEALRVGAFGYLTKAESTERLVTAIREVVDNRTYFSESVRRRIVVDVDRTRLRTSPRSRASTLTKRELEVLGYVAQGLAKKEIARMMHLSTKTVDKHCSNLMTKLDVHDRVELARFAIREQLVEA